MADMHIDDAIARIGEIHDHLARTEVYRGYRAVPVALSGVLAIAGAVIQPHALNPDGAFDIYGEYVLFWVALAGAATLLATVGIARSYARDTSLGRRRARKVISQFLPAFAAGALVAAAIGWRAPDYTPLLPGLWCVIFSLGIFASRPQLPRAIGWVGLYYLAVGGVLLLLSSAGPTGEETSLEPWTMAVAFGPGQLAAAAVLWWKVERREDSPGENPDT